MSNEINSSIQFIPIENKESTSLTKFAGKLFTCSQDIGMAKELERLYRRGQTEIGPELVLTDMKVIQQNAELNNILNNKKQQYKWTIEEHNKFEKILNRNPSIGAKEIQTKLQSDGINKSTQAIASHLRKYKKQQQNANQQQDYSYDQSASMIVGDLYNENLENVQQIAQLQQQIQALQQQIKPSEIQQQIQMLEAMLGSTLQGHTFKDGAKHDAAEFAVRTGWIWNQSGHTYEKRLDQQTLASGADKLYNELRNHNSDWFIN